ncbi:MAG: penicillin acylase family protein, partial [Longimicrobiales bacterium]
MHHIRAHHAASLAVVMLLTLRPPPAVAQEILWDQWGVPHIYADDLGSLAYAFGWAQAQSHGDLLLRLYGQARGRAAEYWGEQFVDSDRWVRVNGIPGRAQAWLAQATSEERVVIEAFVDGVNAYAAQHPDALDDTREQVLPVRAEDVLAHVQRAVHFTFITSPDVVEGANRALTERNGSNAWAIAPSRSAGGHALLLANPHLPWGDLFTWYETQLVGGGLDAYGVALVGMPLPNIAFNQRLGWTHTVNTYDGADTYALTLSGDGYRWDGGVRAFDVRPDTLRMRRDDGTIDAQPFDIVSSVHGPVIARSGQRAVALRVAGLDRPHMLGQTLAMLRARD